MFEMIGLLIGTAFVFALATGAGLILAIPTWFLVRKQRLSRIPLTLVAISLPVIAAAWCWLCVAFLPGESLFGDIDQPLPNGYALKALGKMPTFAYINKEADGSRLHNDSRLSQSIGLIGADGPLVFGQYSHPVDSFELTPNEPFFLFNTATGETDDFPDRNTLEAHLGHRAEIVEGQFFRSQEPAYIAQQRWHKVIMFVPPSLLTATYFGWLIYLARRKTKRPL